MEILLVSLMEPNSEDFTSHHVREHYYDLLLLYYVPLGFYIIPFIIRDYVSGGGADYLPSLLRRPSVAKTQSCGLSVIKKKPKQNSCTQVCEYHSKLYLNYILMTETVCHSDWTT